MVARQSGATRHRLRARTRAGEKRRHRQRMVMRALETKRRQLSSRTGARERLQWQRTVARELQTTRHKLQAGTGAREKDRQRQQTARPAPPSNSGSTPALCSTLLRLRPPIPDPSGARLFDRTRLLSADADPRRRRHQRTTLTSVRRRGRQWQQMASLEKDQSQRWDQLSRERRTAAAGFGAA